MRRRLSVLMLAVVAGAAAPAAAATISALAMTPGVLTLTADAPPAVAWQLALSAPDRLVVDLPAVLAAPLAAPGAGSVVRVRGAMFSPGVARLVLELSAPVEIVTARSSATGLTITLRRTTPAGFAAAVARGRRPLPVLSGGPVVPATSSFELPADMFRAPTAPATAPAATPATAPPPPAGSATSTAVAGPPAEAADPPVAGSPPSPPRRAGVRSRSGGKPLVVIDAGHGGKDVGAISVDGRYEKDVTLAIARAAAAELRRSGRVRVLLTRDDDRFIPLGGRVTIARRARADLFISIHADSAANPEARGASVYTLSAVASDAVAARLAARENKADIIGGVNLGLVAPEVGDIMVDLSRRATTNVSVAFADVLQAELESRIRFRGEFHHFAGFYVLKAPDVPSVLLETGYVSNVEDAELLFSDSGRRRIAQGVARAAERHLAGD